MSYDKARFFKELPRVRKSSEQVQATESIVDQWFLRYPKGDIRHLAYILATAYHETAGTMEPIREFGHGRGRRYGLTAGPYKQVYYGRGYVQLTWLDNYIKATRELRKRGLLSETQDLAKTPDLALDPKIAADILFLGMYDGWFTGKRLAHYINSAGTDFIGARRIINGLDKARLIAGYAEDFYDALKKSIIQGELL